MKNIAVIIVVMTAAFAAGIWTVNHRPDAPKAVHAKSGFYRVAHVSDGDTMVLEDGQHVRLIGIDTPETHDNAKLARDVARRHSNRQTQLVLGVKSAEFTAGLLKDQSVRLEMDVEPKDRYGRTLAYVYLADGTFVNKKIIREGYAYPLTVPPNVRYAHQFKQWFDEARDQKRGLWQ